MDLNVVSKETRLNFRSDLIGHFQRSREELLPALHWVQEEYGYLPEWTLEILSWHLGVPASEVYGAVTSYPELSLAVPQTHKISVCTGLAVGSSLLNNLGPTNCRALTNPPANLESFTAEVKGRIGCLFNTVSFTRDLD